MIYNLIRRSITVSRSIHIWSPSLPTTTCKRWYGVGTCIKI